MRSRALVAEIRSGKGHCREKRLQPRFTAQFRSTFTSGQREGRGKTLDLSDGGCRIETDKTVDIGASFECRIYAPGLDWPLRVDLARVRWVKGNVFGLEFLTIKPGEKLKLRKVISSLKAELS